MICTWCYGPIKPADRSIVNRFEETVHLECAETEIGLAIDRTAEQYMRYMGMSDDEIRVTTSAGIAPELGA